MNLPNKTKVTLMIDTAVYLGLQEKVGVRGLGEYLSQLARPYVVKSALAASYKEQAADKQNKEEAGWWEDSDGAEIKAENTWQL